MIKSLAVFTFCLLVLLVAGLVVDAFLPTLTWAFDARLLLVPVLFFACALTLPFPLMLGFATVAGVVWDARQMVVMDGGVVPFGYSVLLFGLTGALMQGLRPLFRRGKWFFPMVLVGAATVILLSLEWFFVGFQRGEFATPDDFWPRVGVNAMLAMLVSPLLFLLIFKLARASGFRVELLVRR